MRALVLLFVVWAGVAPAQCRQALVFALDVSGSVDARELRLQRNGLARALRQPLVRKALLIPGMAPVHVAAFEWAGPTDQNLLIPWQPIRSAADIDRIADRLRAGTPRPTSRNTALGAAMAYGQALLDDKPDCWVRTLDVSGDGESNRGIAPDRVVMAADVTVNALVVGASDNFGGDDRGANIRWLTTYFDRNVLRGPDAFVEVALGFETYAAAMERKLLRELRTIALSDLLKQAVPIGPATPPEAPTPEPVR